MPSKPFDSDIADLQLLHLADSALPIGALAHSFGLESLVSCGLLTTHVLPEFLRGFLEEAGFVEAVFCRAASRLLNTYSGDFDLNGWLELNDRLSALKPARETREGSASLGRNFLSAVAALDDFPVIREALGVSKRSGSLIHYSPAFGLTGAVFEFDNDRATSVFLHQTVANLVSACQRLLPLGQTEATRILWSLKTVIKAVAKQSAECAIDDACCFMPMLDWAAMEHPALSTRLFIS